jgi:hypothetical protein
MIPTVEKGTEKTWNLSVNPKSILALIPDEAFEKLSVVAAFSEFQQLPGWGLKHSDAFNGIERPAFEHAPCVVRSNPVVLGFDGKWAVAGLPE